MVTLEEVHPWLNQFDVTHLRPDSRSLIEKMEAERLEGRAVDAEAFLEQIKGLAGQLRDHKEVAELLVECACSAYSMGDLTKAEATLVEALRCAWSDLHRRAVIHWMMGCVQWQSLHDRQEAVVSWRNGLVSFESLADQPDIPGEQRDWYRQSCALMQQSLVEALREVNEEGDHAHLAAA
jgi:hypothetical protein